MNCLSTDESYRRSPERIVRSGNEHFIIALERSGYPGVALYNPVAGFQPLLPPSPESDSGARSLGTDGNAMVWTNGQTRTGEFKFATNEVFTAPYTISPTALSQTRRRVTKADGGGSSTPWSVGCGYAAQRWGKGLQIVRLSDGATWRPIPVGVKYSLSPGAITCEHIYGALDGGGVARIRLDTLGEPSPAE